MAIEPVPNITPAPTPGPQRGDESTFDDRMDAKIRWDENAPAEFLALGNNVVHNAGEAAASAAASLAAANNAAAYRDSALAYRDAAHGHADDAAISASSAGSSAAAAAASASAAATISTANSTTSLAIGTGDKVFTVPAGKQFPAGVPYSATSVGAPANRMFGTVKSYSGTTLTIAVDLVEGTGTYNDWVLAPAGARGPTGGTAGGQLTGALDEKKGTDLASAATIDPWSTGGNVMTLTGTVLVTGIVAAPQAGARRTLIAAAAASIQAGANILIDGVASGSVYTLSAGDRVDIVAETATSFHLNVRRRNGKATAGTVPVEVILTASQAWTVAATDFEIEMCGGGQNGKSSGDYGGACGAYAKKRYTGATIGATATITIGTGGASTSSGTRNNGGTSSFVLSGFTTVSCGGGADAGATATGGDINVNGVRGDAPALIGVSNVSGTIVELYRSGRGADGMLGCGAPSHGTSDSTYSPTGWGSGGSGSRDTLSGSAAIPSTVGSAGQGGVCKIRYFI